MSHAVLMMGSDQYCLKWNNHWANLVRVFNSLRHSETFVDVTLACEGRHLKAHRLVLSACSPYFKELLVSHPDKHPIVILKDVRFSELQSLIQFIYNGEVSVDQQDLASLLDTAKELQIRGLADNHASKSLPSPPHPPPPSTPPVVAKAINSEWSALKDSTKSSSSLLPTKPNDEPTNLTIRPINQSLDNGASAAVHSPPDHLPQPSSPPNLIMSPAPSSPHSSLPEVFNGPQPSTKAYANSSSSSVGNKDGGPSREGSPLCKRRKLSQEDHRQLEEVPEDALSVIPDEVIRTKFMSDSEMAEPDVKVLEVDSSSNKPEPLRINGDFSGKKESLDPEPALDIMKQPKDKPPDKEPYVEESEEDDGPMSIQPPEVILEEGDDDDEEARVITTNGTSSPRPIRSTSASSSLSEAPISSTTPIPMSPQVSFLQQALAMGMQQPLHFLQHPSTDQSHQPKALGSHQPMSPSGLAQAKNFMSFVDLLKAMGASLSPGSQAGLIANTNGKSSGGCSTLPNSGSVSPISSNGGSRDSDRSNPLTCHICARIMPSMHVLEEHVRIHEEEKPYKCEQCGQRYKYQSAFVRHQEQNHTAKLPGDKPYRCDVCGQCFKYHKSFTKHRANHDLLDNFLKTEPGEDGKGAIRAFQESYLQRLLHPSSFQHPTDALITTIKEETSDASEQELSKDAKSPLVTSTSVSGVLGPENGEIKEEEDDDIDIDEIVPDVPGEGEEDFDDSTGRFFYCIQCKFTFRDLKGFDVHCISSPPCSSETLKEVSVGGDISVTSIPSSEAKGSSTSQASISTSLGGGSTKAGVPPLNNTSLVFSTPPGMLYTLVSGMPQSSCFSNVSPSPTILNLSKFVNINNIPPLPSFANSIRPQDTLTFAAAAASNLTNVNNLLAGMEEERPFKCPYCQKGFKGRENLKLHIRTHTGEKPYNCGVCGKAFGGRSDMNRHLRIHTGEKPYPCKVCGKKFARADYLSKHITTHLGIPFAKPVHSLQQSLQNLENMQNLQNLENMQNLHSANLLSLPALQNLQSVTGLHNLQNSFPSLQSLQQSVQHLQNLQSVTNILPHQNAHSVIASSVTPNSLLTTTTDSTTANSVMANSVTASSVTTNNLEEIPNLSK